MDMPQTGKLFGIHHLLKSPSRRAVYGYLELFSGAGLYKCDGMECPLEDSSLRAFKNSNRFSVFGFLSPRNHRAEPLNQAFHLIPLTR